jgi:hypothetical protein
MELEVVDVLMHPLTAWKDGIRIFPAVKIEDEVLCGFLVAPSKVRRFIEKHIPEGKKPRPISS